MFQFGKIFFVLAGAVLLATINAWAAEPSVPATAPASLSSPATGNAPLPALRRSLLHPVPGTIKIDGDLSEWAGHQPIMLECNGQYERSGSAKVYLAWNETGLHLAARVWDSSPYQLPPDIPRSASRGVQWPGSDALLLNLTVPKIQADASTRPVSPATTQPQVPSQATETYELALKPAIGVEGKAAVLSAKRGNSNESAMDGSRIASGKLDDGWTVEAMIPWSLLNNFNPAQQQELGVRVLLNDVDPGSDDHMENARRLEWITLSTFYAHMIPFQLSHAAPPLPLQVSVSESYFLEQAGLDVQVIGTPDQLTPGTTVEIETTGGLVAKRATTLRKSLGDRFVFAQERIVLPIPGASPGKASESSVSQMAPLSVSVRVPGTDGAIHAYATTVRPDIVNLLRSIEQAIPESALTALPTVRRGLPSLYKACALELLEKVNDPQPGTRAQAYVDLERFIRHARAMLDPAKPVPDLRYAPNQAWLAQSDQSWQFFSLRVPEKIQEGKRYPLTVVTHGAARYATRATGPIKQLKRADDDKSDPNAARTGPEADSFSIGLQGRGNAHTREGIEELEYAYRWALANLPVDPDRVTVSGHSLGGQAALSYATWFPDRWAVVGAYSPTPATSWMHSENDLSARYLSGLMDWTDKLENLRHAAVFVVFGEQEIAARRANKPDAALMEGLNWLGVRHGYCEVPGKGHLYDLPKIPADLRSNVRPAFPHHVSFATGSVAQGKAWWVEVDLLDKAHQPGRIAANIDSPSLIRVNTQNLRQFTLKLDRDIDPGKKLLILVDAQEVSLPEPKLPLNLTITRKDDGQWQMASERWPSDRLLKKPGLSGPMREITLRGSLIVYGTGAGTDNWVLRRKAEQIAREQNGVHFNGNQRSGARFIIKADNQVTPEELASHNLWLIGNARENRVVASIADKLPIQVGPETLGAGEQTFTGQDYAVNFIYPSPLAGGKYVYINAGLTPRSYNHTASHEHLFDYCVNLNDGIDNRPVLLGVFSSNWKFDQELILFHRK